MKIFYIGNTISLIAIAASATVFFLTDLNETIWYITVLLIIGFIANSVATWFFEKETNLVMNPYSVIFNFLKR